MRAALMQTGLEVSFKPKSENLALALNLIRNTEADLMVFPEMWPIGYASFDRYKAEAEPLEGPLVQTLQQAARNKGCWLVPGSFAETLDGKLYNTTMLINPDGDIMGVYRKIHVFGYQSQEKDIVSGGQLPVVIETPFGKVGLAICYDLRFPELFRHMTKNGAQMFIVPASWPQSRLNAWELFVTARAHENLAWCLACNAHAHSLAVAPSGEVMAKGCAQPENIFVDIDMALVEKTRHDFPALKDARWQF